MLGHTVSQMQLVLTVHLVLSFYPHVLDQLDCITLNQIEMFLDTHEDNT